LKDKFVRWKMRRLAIFALIAALMLAGCISPAPAPVNLIAPADGITAGSLTPTLSWSGGTADTTYKLVIAGDSNFQKTVTDDANLRLVNYTVPSGKLNANKLYYWMVQAHRSGQDSAWSAARSFRTPGAGPASTGNIRVTATLDGAPWNGTLNFRVSGPYSDSENTVPWSFNTLPAGSYTVTYNFGGPRNASLSDITPAPTLQLAAGGTGYFTLNFRTPSSSRLTVGATLDGADWPGNINYSIYGPFKDIDTYVPHTFIAVPAGAYTVSYNSGGPQGAVFHGISPSASQTLSAGAEITYKLNFTSGRSSTLSVTALYNGSAWTGPAQFSLSGPVSGSYSSLPLRLGSVPAGTYRINYLSGGPASTTMGSVTPDSTLVIDGNRPGEFTLHYYAQPQNGSVAVNATLNGTAWTGPVSFAVNGPIQSSDYQVPRRYGSAPAGYYTVSYLSGGPANAALAGITPAPSQSLSAGQAISFSLNFVSRSSTGTIMVNATVDGRPWVTNPGSGPITYYITKPELADTEEVIPVTLRDYPTGSYTLTYDSGGPIGATLTGISPSANQYLSAGGTIAFTLHFTSESRGFITVDASLNGRSWSGPVEYVVSGPYVESGDSVSMTFHNAPQGTYRVDYRGGGPDDAHFAGVSPSSRELQPGGSISFTLMFTGLMPGPMPGPVPHPTPGPMPGPVPNPTPEPMPGPVPNPTPEPMPGPVPNPTHYDPMPGPMPNPDEEDLLLN
jgi:hypothetical protein